MKMNEVVRHEGGSAEEVVPLQSIDVPDLWHVGVLLSDLALARNDKDRLVIAKRIQGNERVSKHVLDCWYLCHDLLKHALSINAEAEDADQGEKLKRLRKEQQRRFREIKEESGYTIVTCGECGAVILVGGDDSGEEVNCYSCGNDMDYCDCPDLWD